MLSAAPAGLDLEQCYRAYEARDARFDGRFFVCVTSTGIYCRPVCSARTPKRENVRFAPSAAAAEGAGFRACLKCRPETAPSSAAHAGTAATVRRALKLIEAGALDDAGVERLAERLGLGERQLRRLFQNHLGASPSAVAASRRLGLARHMLLDSDLPMIQVADAAGFRSLRRFNQIIRDAYGRPPTALRRQREKAPISMRGALTLTLHARAPIDWARLFRYLGPRAIPGIEEVTGTTYRRSWRIGAAAGVLEAGPGPQDRQIRLTIVGYEGETLPLGPVVAGVKRLFDVEADIPSIDRHLSADPALKQLLPAGGDLRIPGGFDPFELAVRAILGQQVSVTGATTLAARVVARAGRPLAGATGTITRTFPTPEDLLGANLDRLGCPGARVNALNALAEALAAGNVDLMPGADLERTIAKLTALKGVGPWTASYIALRALGEADAFPAGDLGLQKALGGLSERELKARAEAWRPWRGHAAMAIWLSLPAPSAHKPAKGTHR